MGCDAPVGWMNLFLAGVVLGFPNCQGYSGPMIHLVHDKNNLATLCDLFGMVKWPFPRLSDLQLGDQQVTLNHLNHVFSNLPKSLAIFFPSKSQ